MSYFRFNHEGGVERASYELASRLATSVDLTLVATDVTPPPQVPLRWHRVEGRIGPAFLIPVTYSRAASRSISGLGFDLIHNQGACAVRNQDIITAHSCHRAWWGMKFSNGPGETLRALVNPHHLAVLRIEKRNYRPGAFRRVIAVSNGVGREIVRHYGVPAELITVIPNAVDISRFQPSDAAGLRARVRARHGFSDDEVVLLFVGKEFRRKGLALVIDALAQLPVTARLLVVGGDDQSAFRAQAKSAGVADRVVFVGHSSSVQDYFQAADVFTFPTMYEAFALVSLEAAAAGLPLVTTRVNGTEDFVVDGANGFFVERDSGDLARKLAPIVQDRDLRCRLGAQARRDVREYTWGSVAQRTLELYREVWHEKRALDDVR